MVQDDDTPVDEGFTRYLLGADTQRRKTLQFQAVRDIFLQAKIGFNVVAFKEPQWGKPGASFDESYCIGLCKHVDIFQVTVITGSGAVLCEFLEEEDGSGIFLPPLTLTCNETGEELVLCVGELVMAEYERLVTMFAAFERVQVRTRLLPQT